MNRVIKYMIIYNKLNSLKDHTEILLFLYNYKKSNKLFWLYIMWSPLPENIMKHLIYFYTIDNYLKSTIPYEIISMDYKNIIHKTMSDITDKTFIKFLYDLKYLDLKYLYLFSNESHFIKEYKGIVLNANNYYNIDNYDYIKINKIKNNNNSFYNYISVNMDNKLNKFGYYITELIKIEDQWWLIRTGYIDKNLENEETEKYINWIFSEYI